MTRIGVATEGKTDLILLQVVLDEGLPEHAPFDLVALVPEPDATGTLNRGGWRYVQAWCSRKSAAARADEHLRPLFAGSRECRSILFMIDADIAQEAARSVGVVLREERSEQVAWLRGQLRAWMKTSEPGEVDWIAVQAPETWLAAALDPELAQPESVSALDVLKRKGLVQSGALRTPKDPQRHVKWAERLRGQVAGVARRCPTLATDLTRLRASLERGPG